MSDDSPVESAGSAPASSSLISRVVRWIFVLLLGLALSFLSLLAIASAAPVVRETLRPLMSAEPKLPGVAILVTLLLALIVPFIVVGLLRKRPLVLVLLAVIAAGMFGYLAWDDPVVRRPLTVEELAPALPGDEASYAVVKRYLTDGPATVAYKEPKFKVAEGTKYLADDPVQWTKYVQDHRAEIEAGWAELAPVRAWWDELADQSRIADLLVPDDEAPMLAFKPLRQYAQFASAIASLQALDGHGDEAIATVSRLYEVSSRLEPNSRTLIRTMIAKVLQKIALQTATFVLDHATVSAERRAAFAATLGDTAGGAPGARRLMLIEYTYFRPTFAHIMSGGVRSDSLVGRLGQQCVSVLAHVVINPRATQNMVGDRYYELAALAEQRKVDEIARHNSEINRDFLDGYHMKNIGGRLIADMAMPVFTKVIKTYWEIEDRRLALIKRLTS